MEATRPAFPPLDTAKESLSFHALDWHAEDTENYVDECGETPDTIKERYVITIFGVTAAGNSVAVNVYGFLPLFYIELPDSYTAATFARVVSAMQNKVGKWYKDGVASSCVVKRKKLLGFTNGRDYKFGEVRFYNKRAMYAYLRTLDDTLSVTGVGKVKLTAWESNIDPLLRFTHFQDVSPCGWIRLPADKYQENDYNPTRCQAVFNVEHADVMPDPREGVAPLIIASFDIEADSSHGDFPQGKKDYKRLAADIVNHYNDCARLRRAPRDLMDLLRMAFVDERNDAGIAFVYTKGGKVPSVIHVQSLVQAVANEKLLSELIVLKRSKADRVAAADVSGLEVGETINNGIDRVTTRLLDLFNKYLPPVHGDKVIQIGTVLCKYGDPSFSVKHIITLDTSHPVEGTIVESYKTEREVLLAWTRFIQAADPDILTQWNGESFRFTPSSFQIR